MKLLQYIFKIRNGIAYRYRNHYFLPFGMKCQNDFRGVRLNTPNKVSQRISSLLEGDSPCLISRFGSNELHCALFYKKNYHPFWFFRKLYPFWVPQWIKSQIHDQAGFFPVRNDLLCVFSDLIFNSAKEIDVLGSWIQSEKEIEDDMTYECCPLLYLEPYWSSTPWSRSLKGKKVLVVHPFAEIIKKQYQKRHFLFPNPEILPDFSSLTVVKAVQSLGDNHNGFKTWFDALKYMEDQVDAVDYDIALIGCGAYGLPLAAHCKRTGKKAVHLGGALQLLFGIKGRRWEEEGYGSDYNFNYKPLLNNPNWVRPTKDETPTNSSKVEDACYW